MIKLNNLNYQYKSSDFKLSNINLEIQDGEFLCVMGKNGSGKSTFSKLISGLIPYKNGEITINRFIIK